MKGSWVEESILKSPFFTRSEPPVKKLKKIAPPLNYYILLSK